MAHHFKVQVSFAFLPQRVRFSKHHWKVWLTHYPRCLIIMNPTGIIREICHVALHLDLAGVDAGDAIVVGTVLS